MIAAGSDALFRRLAEVLGEPELSTDPRFADNPSRVRNRPALVAAVSVRTRRFETADLLERLSKAGVPAAPILTIDRVLDEPQTAASGMILEAAHPRLSGYRTVGLPIRWNRERPGGDRNP
jgi:crotonobetainyl-CoA:carnitine CoA-transferase CaiB-like acyl-CoA transferase